MTYEQWIETYKPMQNYVANYEAAYDNTMFETCGDECKFIHKLRITAPDTIWTLVQGDNDEWIIASGYHYVNRMGYFVSQVPFTYDMEIQIA